MNANKRKCKQKKNNAVLNEGEELCFVLVTKNSPSQILHGAQGIIFLQLIFLFCSNGPLTENYMLDDDGVYWRLLSFICVFLFLYHLSL